MSELEIQENMSAEEAFMDTESAYEEIPEAFQKLAQLLGQDQFELLFPDKDVENQDEMRLVYLMNDAVESFLVFSGARMTGHYQKDYEGELDATLSQEDGEYVLVVYQGETVVTIFFQDLLLEMNLYNYGDVGHFWVKGYEYLRILEYRLAILSDKCEYLGEKATSDTERKLAKLVHETVCENSNPLCCYYGTILDLVLHLYHMYSIKKLRRIKINSSFFHCINLLNHYIKLQ